MPRFEAFLKDHGLDKQASPDWLMVPLGGTNHVYLADADDMTVTPVNPGMVEVREAPIGRKRLIDIRGRMPGSTYIDVRSSRGLATRLEVCVKKRKQVSVVFHYVEDNTGRRTARKLGDESTLLDDANRILLPQTNVEFVNHGAEEVKVKSDLGAVVCADEKHTPSYGGYQREWNAVVSSAIQRGQLDVFFVWEMEGSKDTTPFHDDAQAATKPDFGYTVFEDNVPKAGQALAHEFGHALGLYDRYQERDKRFLMFHAVDACTGYALSKYDVQTMNP